MSKQKHKATISNIEPSMSFGDILKRNHDIIDRILHRDRQDKEDGDE